MENSVVSFGPWELTLLRGSCIEILWSWDVVILFITYQMRGWLTCSRPRGLYVAVLGALTRADAGPLHPFSSALFPAFLLFFIHSHQVTDTTNLREQRAPRLGGDLHFQFSLAGLCSWGCSGQTPGSLDFPVWEVHGDSESREDLAEAGQQPPVGWLWVRRLGGHPEPCPSVRRS